MDTHLRVGTALLASALPLAAACGGGDRAGGEWAGEVADSAGVAVVHNPAGGVWKEGEAWTVRRVLEIGAASGEPELQFGQIGGIAPLPDGRIVVLDQQAQELRIFGPDGAHLRTVGGPGSGPGEFAAGAGPVLVSGGDTLLVPDVTNQRLNRYDPAGEPLGSVALDLAVGIPIAWQDDGLGRVASQLRPFNLPGQEPREAVDVIVEVGSDGSVADTLRRFDSGTTFQFTDGRPRFEFFAPEPVWSLLEEGGLVSAVNDDYRLFVYGDDGALERIFSRPFEPRAVSAEDRQILADAISKIWEDFGIGGEQLEALRGAIGFADTYPAFAQVRGGPGGSIWVQRLRTPSEMSPEELEDFNPQLGFGSPDWDVFDAEGRFLGTIEMPERFQPIRFQDDRIYGIWRDELDVQRVWVLALDRGGSSER